MKGAAWRNTGSFRRRVPWRFITWKNHEADKIINQIER